ncbi:hypothetical protein [Salibacterium aidingense]|uniref:hypothetical protein n=1 Tax=Salibacterium aidingense TaxID=384933 RepID=UPI003BDEEC52
MDQSELQQCITECESALSHLNNAIDVAHNDSREKMEHAVQDLEQCIAECRNLL